MVMEDRGDFGKINEQFDDPQLTRQLHKVPRLTPQLVIRWTHTIRNCDVGCESLDSSHVRASYIYSC